MEGYTPALQDILRLLEGKARDFQVKVGELYSEEQVLNSIFTRLLETDFIAQTQREEILAKLLPVLEESESEPYDEEKVLNLTEAQEWRWDTALTLPGTMALAAAAVGALVTVLPELGGMGMSGEIGELLVSLLATMLPSLGIIAVLLVALRVRESQQEVSISSRSESLERGIKFEREVAKVISDLGLTAEPSGPSDLGYDFLVESGNHQVLVKSKSWTRPVSHHLITQVAKRLERTVKDKDASEGLVVTKSPVKLVGVETGYESVQFVTTKQLKHRLVEIRSDRGEQRPQ